MRDLVRDKRVQVCGSLVILGGLLIAVARRLIAIGERLVVVCKRLSGLAQVVFGEARTFLPFRAAVAHVRTVLSGSAGSCQTATIDATAT